MAQIVFVAHKAEIEQTPNYKAVRHNPLSQPLKRVVFEAASMKEVLPAWEAFIADVKQLGQTFTACAICLRGTGRKPAGFDKANLRLDWEA